VRFTLRLAVLTLIGVGAARPFSTDDFPEKAIAFNEHWSRFFRSYLGCPKGATDASQCNPKVDGKFDYSEFNKAAKEARALFALENK
jgi:hypothetical protein